MKKSKYPLLLLTEAIATLIFTKGFDLKAESILDLLNLPVKKFADFLGFLSVKSSIGNIIAIIIFTLFCLIPIFVLAFRVIRKKFVKTDSLLVLLSAVLFAVVYLLINPSEMGLHGYGSGDSMVAFSFWSLLAGYLVLKFTDTLKNTSATESENLLALILKIIGAVFVFTLCSLDFTKSEVVVITLLSFVNSTLPSVFGLLIVFSCLKVLSCFTIDRYSESTINSAEMLSRLCIVALKTSVGITVLISVLQLRFIKELSDVNFSINIPLIPVGFILLVLILTGFLKDGKILKDDNDSFI